MSWPVAEFCSVLVLAFVVLACRVTTQVAQAQKQDERAARQLAHDVIHSLEASAFRDFVDVKYQKKQPYDQDNERADDANAQQLSGSDADPGSEHSPDPHNDRGGADPFLQQQSPVHGR